jgi:hypothetical protein
LAAPMSLGCSSAGCGWGQQDGGGRVVGWVRRGGERRDLDGGRGGRQQGSSQPGSSPAAQQPGRPAAQPPSRPAAQPPSSPAAQQPSSPAAQQPSAPPRPKQRVQAARMSAAACRSSSQSHHRTPEPQAAARPYLHIPPPVVAVVVELGGAAGDVGGGQVGVGAICTRVYDAVEHLQGVVVVSAAVPGSWLAVVKGGGKGRGQSRFSCAAGCQHRMGSSRSSSWGPAGREVLALAAVAASWQGREGGGPSWRACSRAWRQQQARGSMTPSAGQAAPGARDQPAGGSRQAAGGGGRPTLSATVALSSTTEGSSAFGAAAAGASGQLPSEHAPAQHCIHMMRGNAPPCCAALHPCAAAAHLAPLVAPGGPRRPKSPTTPTCTIPTPYGVYSTVAPSSDHAKLSSMPSLQEP